MATVERTEEQVVDLSMLAAPTKSPPMDFDDRSSTTALAVAPSASTELAVLVERTRTTLHGAVPINTRRAYEGDLRRFAEWCASMGFTPMPSQPATVAVYLRALADKGHKCSTIERALAALCTAHLRSGHPSPWTHPLVVDMRAGLRQELGVRPNKKRAADEEVLRRLLAVVPTEGLLGLRDRAMLTLGWCAALRRSELVALDVAHVTRAPKGGVVFVATSKTDQERHGEEVPIFFSNLEEHCPMRSLDAWVAASGIVEGAIFRQLGREQKLGERLSPPAVRDRVRHYARTAGLVYADYGAHSLRSGFITTAARRGKDLDSIMVTSRHRSERVARGYIQRETLHERGAGEGLL
jgi:site-specific recombinase XerD